MTEFISNREIYGRVIRDAVPKARQRLWIATADIKDMYVEMGGRDMDLFLKVLAQLIGRNVEIRLIHAKEPGQISAKTSTAIRVSSRAWSAYCVQKCISSVSALTDAWPISGVRI